MVYKNIKQIGSNGIVKQVDAIKNTMKKELFVKCIKSIEKQIDYDISIAKNLAVVFADSNEDDLLPKNHFLQNSLLEVLMDSMNDDKAKSWIEYFCWVLNFGKESFRLKAMYNGAVVPLSDAGELWEFLNKLKHPL